MNINDVINRMKIFYCVDSDSKLAKILGITPANLYDRKARNAIPHEAIINNLRDTDANLEWIFYGLGEMKLTPSLKLTDESENNFGKIAIRYFPDISASAGFGCLNGDYCQSSVVYVDKNLFPKVSSKKIEAIRVHGDSMEPTISNGDMIFVDKLQHEIKNGKIYIIRMNEEIFVKRIFSAPKGIIIKSDNQNYPSFEVQVPDIKIIGQVIYTMEYHG